MSLDKTNRKKATYTYSCNIELEKEFEEIVEKNCMNKSQIIENLIKKWVAIYKKETTEDEDLIY